jgi:hypothetical protein
MRKQQVLTVLALAGWVIACSSSVVRALEIKNPHPGQTFRYTLPGNQTETVLISSDNVFLDCGGASITNPRRDYSGIGIAVLNAKNVTIANCHVSGFDVGIVIEDSPHSTASSKVVNNKLFDNLLGLYIVDNSVPVHVLYNRIYHNSGVRTHFPKWPLI